MFGFAIGAFSLRVTSVEALRGGPGGDLAGDAGFVAVLVVLGSHRVRDRVQDHVVEAGRRGAEERGELADDLRRATVQ